MKLKKQQTPVHIIIGAEHVQKDAYIEKVRSAYPSLSDTFDLERFDIKTHSLVDILSKAKTFPFCSDVQMFIVRINKKMTKADKELLAHYVENPPSCTVIIFECDEADKELMAAVKNSTVVSIYDDSKVKKDVSSYVTTMVRQQGKTITPQAVRLFKERAGDQIDMAMRYLEQLLLYIGPRSEIGESDVTEIVRESLSYNSFALANALVAKQFDRVLTLMRDMLDNGYSVQEVIAQLHWQLKRVYSAKRMMQKREPKNSIGKTLRIGPTYVDGFLRDVGRFKMSDLARAIKELMMLDHKIKRGLIDPVIGIEQYVVSVIQ